MMNACPARFLAVEIGSSHLPPVGCPQRCLPSIGRCSRGCWSNEVASSTDVQDRDRPTHPATAGRLTYDSPQTQFWRIGLVLETPVTCTNVLATFTVPMEWPEQKVVVTGQTVDPIVSHWEVRNLPGGARQVVVRMARVPAGATVNATFNFQIDRARILGPEKTDDLVIPSRPDRELRMFMGNSPYIDASNSTDPQRFA